MALSVDTQAVQEYRDLRNRLANGGASEKVEALTEMARTVRRLDLQMIEKARLGHIGGDYSVTDILVTLYGAVLSVDPQNPGAPERDRFILSKGHSAGALYATLALCGFFPRAELDTFMAPLSALNGHPNRTKVPGVETNTGPLGHGFPVAVGHALAAKLQGSPRRTFVVLGDGELQEGSNWEAAMTAAHYDLSSLTAIVDRNRLQQGARTEETKRLEPLADKWRSFGFEVREIDGHDFEQLLAAIGPSGTDRPVCVIASTVKGKGVSFMEDRAEWHHKVPNTEQVQIAFEELSR
jgi:transketolase